MKQHRNSEETRKAVLAAIGRYEAMVLQPGNFDAATGMYQFDGRITAAAILKLAGVKSRSTLRPAYHRELRAALTGAVFDLKLRTGRIRTSRSREQTSSPPESELARLAQTIAAQHFKILELQAAATEDRDGRPATVNSDRRRRQTPYRR